MNSNFNEDVINIRDYTLDLIYLDELCIILKYESKKSVKNWCAKNEVEIYGTGHRKYIMKYDLDQVLIMPQINNFKRRYGDNWEFAFKLAQNNELYKLDANNEPTSLHSVGIYKPKSEAAKKIK